MPNNRLNLRTHAVVMHGAATTSFLESTLSERSLDLITHVCGQSNQPTVKEQVLGSLHALQCKTPEQRHHTMNTIQSTHNGRCYTAATTLLRQPPDAILNSNRFSQRREQKVLAGSPTRCCDAYGATRR